MNATLVFPRTLLTAATALCIFQLSPRAFGVDATAQVFSEIPTELKQRVAVEQPDATGTGVLVYDLADNNAATVAQTFTWPSANPLAGIGIRFAANATKDVPADVTQQYALKINETTGMDGKPGKELGVYTVTLSKKDVQPENYLYIPFPAPLAMTSGRVYLFQFGNASRNPRVRIPVSRSNHQSGEDAYPEGQAEQFTYATAPEALPRFKHWDVTFFAVSAAK